MITKLTKILATIRRIKLFRINYFTITLFFLIWMLFFDSNDAVTQFKLINKLNNLKTQREYYLKNIEILSKDIEKLSTDNQELEKFAREKYFMKKKNEHIFFVEQAFSKLKQ
jgi:cell division protein DivIC